MEVFGYCRVSSEMQMEGFSIAAQERAIRTYCSMQGWELKHLYVDEGRSARSDDIAKRPAFAQMLADAEEQRIGAIVVHKLDRFARNIVTTLTTLQKLETAGIGFVSINENMDFTSPIGKAMLAMLAAFAQFYSDNLSAETKKGKAERKRQGLYNGALPFGTTVDSFGTPIPDRESWATTVATRQPVVPYDGLVTAFDMAANGATDREIAMHLNRLGHMSSGAWGRNPLTKDSIRVIIRNRFYLGELPDDEHGWIPGRHVPMIDPAIFDKAQFARKERSTGRASGSPRSRVTPFTGILVCGVCGSPMRKQSGKYYRCSRTIQTMQCSEPGIEAASLESQTVAVLNAMAFTDDDQPFIERAIREWVQVNAPSEEQRADNSERLRRLRSMFVDGALSIEEYQEESRRLESMVEASKVYTFVTTSERVSQALRYLSILANAWHTQSDIEKNQVLSELFSAVYVKNRQVAALLPRPEYAVVLAPILDASPRTGGSDGHPMSGCAIDQSSLYVPHVYLPATSRYNVARPRKLTNAQIAMIRLRALETLRDLADEYNVSHETIRTYRQ